MPRNLAHTLPIPGPVWGPYPLRPGDAAPPRRPLEWRSPLAACRRLVRRSIAHTRAWDAASAQERAAALRALQATLRRSGLGGEALARALGIAAACAASALGWPPRATQLLAATALLDNRMADMATGEGKTLAIGLAAAVAALAGMPVHVVTANAYLAERDCDQLAPLFAVLGLRAGTLAGAADDAARRAVYGRDIVYATAKDLAFDFLRDRQAGTAAAWPASAEHLSVTPAPLMRGLCMVLLDEADSILLDEAEVPLILSRSAPHAARRAFLWQALALARQLDGTRDFQVHPQERSAELTGHGEQRLASLCQDLGGPWRRPRYRRDAVNVALAGLHACRRNIDYVVRDGTIELLDEVTGRVASGRVWSRGLHTVVALKERLSPPPETETVAQTTFQRFFGRYWRLCGISGSLWEARGELQAVYGARTVRIPLHRPGRRQQLPARRFASAKAMHAAVVERVDALRRRDRPVLVATDDVDGTLQIAQLLQQRGITHHVLNALQDADEARIVGAAGQAGRVTVATRMAGRGTDIEPVAKALAAGGLHVLSCQHNASRRLDRQLAGRAARHGDPGSVECWTRDDFSGPGTPIALWPRGLWNTMATWPALAWAVRMPRYWAQLREEQRRAALRQTLLEQEHVWDGRLAFGGRAP